MAVVWLEEEALARADAFDFAGILDALSIPVWLRDRKLALKWGNRAFLAAAGVEDNARATATQATIEKSERDLAAAPHEHA